MAEGLCVGPEDYFLSSDEACRRLEAISREQGGRVRALLVAQELVNFCPYQQLGAEEDKEFKGLKERTSWAKDVFPKIQDAVDVSAICSLEERCKARTRDLSGTTQKLLIGVGAVALVTIGTAGAAAAFAPEIAVGLFGGSFTGLNGIALTNASLAMAGGGALAAGGLGMAGGTALITGGGATLGFLGSGGIALAASMGKDYARFMLAECSRLLAFLDVATERCPHEAAALVQKASEAVQRSAVGIEEDAEKEKSKGFRKDGKLLKQLNKGLKYSTSTLEQIGKLQKCLGAGRG